MNDLSAVLMSFRFLLQEGVRGHQQKKISSSIQSFYNSTKCLCSSLNSLPEYWIDLNLQDNNITHQYSMPHTNSQMSQELPGHIEATILCIKAVNINRQSTHYLHVNGKVLLFISTEFWMFSTWACGSDKLGIGNSYIFAALLASLCLAECKTELKHFWLP